jgi:hypothetical protein
MPNELTLFHGATGDEILSVIRERSMRPDRDGLVYFSEKFEDALQHGADTRRKASFAFKALITIPAGATVTRTTKQGNPLTVLVRTLTPLPTRLLEMYVRLGRVGAFELKTVSGIENIKTYLEGQSAAGAP